MSVIYDHWYHLSVSTFLNFTTWDLNKSLLYVYNVKSNACITAHKRSEISWSGIFMSWSGSIFSLGCCFSFKAMLTIYIFDVFSCKVPIMLFSVCAFALSKLVKRACECVCVCVYVHVCSFVCERACDCVCLCVCVYEFYMHTLTCQNAWTRMQALNMRAWVCVCVCVCDHEFYIHTLRNQNTWNEGKHYMCQWLELCIVQYSCTQYDSVTRLQLAFFFF